MPTCKLCLIRKADKENSHIIPKFLGKRLFENSKPKHSIIIDNSGKQRKIQDIPKESHILCSTCEKKFEILETYMSKNIFSINNYTNLINEFKINQIGKNKILNCNNIDPIRFKIFVYSLVWRTSISSLPEFDSYKLDEKTETNLRNLLHDKLKTDHAEFLISTSNSNLIINYDYCVFKPISRKSDDFKGIFTSYKMGEFQFGIFTVDFIFFFFSNSSNMHPAFKYVSNYNNDEIKITLVDRDEWFNLSKLVVGKMLKK